MNRALLKWQDDALNGSVQSGKQTEIYGQEQQRNSGERIAWIFTGF